MKTIFLLSSLVLSTATFAGTLNLKCVASYNLDEVFATEVALRDGDKDVRFGEFGEYQFFLTSRGQNEIELQALNFNGPSRTYVLSKLTTSSPAIKMTLWNRESMLELSCSL